METFFVISVSKVTFFIFKYKWMLKLINGKQCVLC